MRRGAYALAHGPPAYTGKGAGRKINASPYKGSEGPKGVIPKLFLEESRIRRGSHLHRKCQIFAAACTCWVAGASPRPTVVIPARGCRARNPVVRTNRPRPQSCCKPAPHWCHSRAWLPREESLILVPSSCAAGSTAATSSAAFREPSTPGSPFPVCNSRLSIFVPLPASAAWPRTRGEDGAHRSTGKDAHATIEEFSSENSDHGSGKMEFGGTGFNL